MQFESVLQSLTQTWWTLVLARFAVPTTIEGTAVRVVREDTIQTVAEEAAC